MKFTEEEVSKTQYYTVLRIKQSIKFKPGVTQDCFDYEKAARNEVKLAQFKCPLLSNFQQNKPRQ